MVARKGDVLKERVLSCLDRLELAAWLEARDERTRHPASAIERSRNHSADTVSHSPPARVAKSPARRPRRVGLGGET